MCSLGSADTGKSGISHSVIATSGRWFLHLRIFQYYPWHILFRPAASLVSVAGCCNRFHFTSFSSSSFRSATTIIKLIIFVAYRACWVCLRCCNPPNSDMNYRIFIVRTDVTARDCTRGCTDNKRESALKADSGKKIPCRTGESNLRDETDDEISHWPVTKRTDRWRRRSCYRSLLVILGVSTCRSFPGNNSSNIELVSDRDGRYVNCYQWYTGCHDHSLGGNCRYVNG